MNYTVAYGKNNLFETTDLHGDYSSSTLPVQVRSIYFIIMASKTAKIIACLSGCFIKCMKLGIFKSLGVFFIPIQETLQTTHIVLGIWMSMFAVAADIFGELYDCFVKYIFPDAASRIGV